MWGFHSSNRGLTSPGGWIGCQTSTVSAEMFAQWLCSVPTCSGWCRCVYLSPHVMYLCVCVFISTKVWRQMQRCNSKQFRYAHAPYNWSKAVSKERQDQSGIRHLTTGLCLQKMETRSNLKMSQETTGQRSFMIIGDRAHTINAGQELKSSFMEIFWAFSKLPAKEIIPVYLVITIPNVQRGCLVWTMQLLIADQIDVQSELQRNHTLY